jgi:hypothetical protein
VASTVICPRITDLAVPPCASYPLMLNPDASAVEVILRADADNYAVPALRRAGAVSTQLRIPGVHGANNATVYADDIVATANATFANTAATSPTFSYRTADPASAIWGYQVAATTPRASSLS